MPANRAERRSLFCPQGTQIDAVNANFDGLSNSEGVGSVMNFAKIASVGVRCNDT